MTETTYTRRELLGHLLFFTLVAILFTVCVMTQGCSHRPRPLAERLQGTYLDPEVEAALEMEEWVR